LRVRELLLISTIFIAGCSQQGGGGNQAATVSQPGAGILGSLRPKTDPAVVERMRLEEQARQEKQKALEAAAQRAESQVNADGMARVLPKVSMDPIAPPAEEVAQGNTNTSGPNGPIFTPANTANAASGAPIQVPSGPGVPAAPGAMNYGAMPASGGGVGGGLVPPPPAVTLSTQANMGMPAGMPMDPSAMYNNQWMNPYGIPYPQQMQGMVPPAPQVALGRPSGSPFATGPRSSSSDDEEGGNEKKRANFVPITPTGMDSRSSYKQRDDLKALWNGVLKSNSMSLLIKDDKFASELSKVDIGLPGESTKGSFSISQRQVDAVFKNSALDKRILEPVKKVQSDLVQAYYRYLYSYNKFALATQTVAARKQESEVASSDAERQRAAADQSQAQQEADSSKDDMKSAQTELSAIAGPQAAKYIISKVSGVAPSAEALAAGDSSSDQKSGGGGKFGLFHFGGGGSSKKSEPADTVKVASAPEAKDAKDSKESKKTKESKKGKGKKDSGSSKEKTADLSPAPEASDSATATASASSSSSDKSDKADNVPQAPGGISFQLQNVSKTTRKSILTVSIKNGGANNFSFSPDVISISEGNHKLSEAAVRADFDQTMVPPNQEIKGTITIFGRPWNERLAVSLSEGGKTIPMKLK
jgi:hypothetical protein